MVKYLQLTFRRCRSELKDMLSINRTCKYLIIPAVLTGVIVAILLTNQSLAKWISPERKTEYVDKNKFEGNTSFVDKDENPTVTVEEGNGSNLADTELTKRGRRKLDMLGRTDLLDTNRDCQKQLPECIIIGVMKAGTEAYSTFLTVHPQIAMQMNLRSTTFFTISYDKGLPWYKDQMMCSTTDQVSMEKAPQYFVPSHVPKRIFDMNPNIKLILVVRNPIDRAVSQYLQQAAIMKITGKPMPYKSFEDCAFDKRGNVNPSCPYVSQSRYSTIFKRWLQFFPRDQFLIIDGDQFKTDQLTALSKTEDFLGIKKFITKDIFVYNKDTGFYCLSGVGNGKGCLLSGKGREHPKMSLQHLSKLKAHFLPYNQEFNKLSGMRFYW